MFFVIAAPKIFLIIINAADSYFYGNIFPDSLINSMEACFCH